MFGVQLRDPLFGQRKEFGEFLVVEGGFFAGSLDLDKSIVAGHDHVHIDIGTNIAQVVQVETRLAIDDSDADCSDGVP